MSNEKNRSEVLGLIPARAGSKSVPRKNVKTLVGKPLITYTIQEAQKSNYITRLIVSTDDEETANVAKECGAEVPFIRPIELALDQVTDLPVFQHCLTWLSEKERYEPDIVVHLRPTAPLRTSKDIDRGIELLLSSSGDADAVRSVCQAGEHPLKTWQVKDGWLVPFVPENVYGIAESYNQPRQQLPKAFIQNGAVDVVHYKVIMELNSMTGRRVKALVMDPVDSVNIDGPLDWMLAEILMAKRLQQETS